ncbi:Rieske (2Fe-2S) protein [Rugosimonospora acidiphila]|uniref:Cytochrome bc1 complex Rieske iron-sulfur subunit n=1 Tax=Rugosimonospora acidiphila TaxID=556531 RepID=A0ABP9RW50_9ACTN
MTDNQEASGTAQRRAVLAGAGMVGVVAALAGCGNAVSSKQQHPAAESTGGHATSSPTGTPDRGDASSSVGIGQDLVSASEIPVGGGKIFGKQQVVVTQPTPGEFRGFSAVCSHTGCIVSTVEGGVIKCPCHGSLFSADDGSVKAGPAVKPLPRRTVTVRGGNVYLM